MKEKRIHKRWMALWGVFFCTILSAGCGKNSVANGDPNQIAYVAEYKDVDFGQGYINQIMAWESSIYVITNEYIEETKKSSTQFIKTDIVSGVQEEIPLFVMQENESFSGLFMNERGNFVLLSSIYIGEQNKYFIYEVSPEGQKLNEKDITEAIAGSGGQYVQNVTGDEKGNLYMLMNDETGSWMIIAVDSEGIVIGKVTYTDYINNLFCSTDGNLYITAWGNNGMALKKVDMAGQTVGDEIALEISQSSGNLIFASGGTTGTLLSDGKAVYECELETGKCSKLLDWMDSDVNGSTVSRFGITGEGNVWAFNQYYEEEKTSTELIVLNKTTADKVPQKEIITYGTMWVDSDTQAAIIQFNKTNAKYRIRIKEYGSEDYEAGLIQMNTDLAGADGPDIINLSSVNFNQLKSKGVLADIYPYMDKDQTFYREDYLENILKVYESDGKLYGMMPAFAVNTLVGSEKTLQDIDGWNIKELLSFAEKYPDAKLFNTTSGGVLYTFVSSNMDQFINWETGECTFNSEDFISILEYANTFDKEYTDWQSPDHIGTHEGLSTGKHILLEQYISGVNEIQLAEALFDAPVKFVGYPTNEKSGIVVTASSYSYGMSEKSKHKEGVWEFFSYLLSDEFQKSLISRNHSFGIPIKKSFIDAMCEKAMKEEYDTDENGNQVKKSGMTWGYDDIEVEIYAATKEQVTQFKELIEKAQSLRDYDNQMYNIITEETESFFAGQKQAKEVADIIQSRIQIYVNENR